MLPVNSNLNQRKMLCLPGNYVLVDKFKLELVLETISTHFRNVTLSPVSFA